MKSLSTWAAEDGSLSLTGFLAPQGFEAQLASELGDVVWQDERLFLVKKRADGSEQESHWAQNTWHEPRLLQIKSISDAARQLKALQRNWWPYQTRLFRRGELIQAQLPRVAVKPLPFPSALPTAPLGSWTLLAEDLILASAVCKSPYPNGEPNFHEFKDDPPSRAYLKLFEALTLIGRHPVPGERCLELGASPGGWTWVISRLGAQVSAIDRSELDPKIMTSPGVSFIKGDAFSAVPERIGPIDWLFSDVICYPEKLYDFVKLWIDSGRCRNFVCTLKFQGTEHYEITKRFARIPGSTVMHLYNNKHELTWALLAQR